MYLAGLKDIFTDEAQATGNDALVIASEAAPAGYDWPVYAYSNSLPAASTQAPTDNSDWTKLIATAITTWGNYKIASKQADAALRSPYGVYRSPGSSPLYYGSSPLPAYSQPLSGSTLLIGAAVIIAAFLYLKG